MKKSIALVLVFVLTLTATSGCAFLYKQDPHEPPASEMHFELESLPDIGEFVSSQKAEYFFSDGAHKEFEPRADYGAVLPYYAGVEYYAGVPKEGVDYGDYGPFTTHECKFGLMTADGKIITGPIWEEYGSYYGFGENSGFFNFYAPNADNGGSTSIIGADGSWKIETDGEAVVYSLYEFGQPLFMLENGRECKIYSLDGSEVLNVSQYITVLHSYEYWNGDEGEAGREVTSYYRPDIVYADDELILLRTFLNDNIDSSNAEYTALTHSGEKKFSFILENISLNHLGGGMMFCRDYSTEEYFLANLKGERINESSFDSLCYSEADNAALGIKKVDSELLLSWFNEKGELIDEKSLDKNSKVSQLLQSYPLESPSGSVFFDDERSLCYTFFAESVEFPVSKSEIRRLKAVYAPGENDIEPNSPDTGYYIAVYTEDGRCLLCAVTGELICETEQPKYFSSSPTSNWYHRDDIFIRGQYICCRTADDRLIVYSFSGDKCAEADISELISGNEESFYISNFDENIIVMGYYDGHKSNLCAIGLENGSVLYNNILSCKQLGGMYIVAAKTYTAVLNSDGREIMRLSLDDLV